jgi:hypothetical protein
MQQQKWNRFEPRKPPLLYGHRSLEPDELHVRIMQSTMSPGGLDPMALWGLYVYKNHICLQRLACSPPYWALVCSSPVATCLRSFYNIGLWQASLHTHRPFHLLFLLNALCISMGLLIYVVLKRFEF